MQYKKIQINFTHKISREREPKNSHNSQLIQKLWKVEMCDSDWASVCKLSECNSICVSCISPSATASIYSNNTLQIAISKFAVIYARFYHLYIIRTHTNAWSWSAFGALCDCRHGWFLRHYKSIWIAHLSFDLIHRSHVTIEIYAIYLAEKFHLKNSVRKMSKKKKHRKRTQSEVEKIIVWCNWSSSEASCELDSFL